MATITATDVLASEAVLEPAPPFAAQVRTFLWLASGMFSTSSLGLAFLDLFEGGSFRAAGTHFLAAVIAAGLFGVATLLKLGPDEA